MKTINPIESGVFNSVIQFDEGIAGPTRAGISIKGQNLYYSFARYTGKQGSTLVDQKEINCGGINLKKLALIK